RDAAKPGGSGYAAPAPSGSPSSDRLNRSSTFGVDSPPRIRHDVPPLLARHQGQPSFSEGVMALEFTYLDGHPVHRQRAREILAQHPEVRKLMGPNPASSLWVVGLVAVQWLAAFLVTDLSSWWLLLVAYLFGAFVNHALYVLIH